LARVLLDRGMVPVAVRKGEKRPIEKSWQKRSVSEALESWPQTEQLFLQGAQLGVTGDDLLFLDFEDYDTFSRFMREAMDDKPGWWDKANHTWFELTGVRCPKCGYEAKNSVIHSNENGLNVWVCGKCGLQIDPEKKECRGVRLIFRVPKPFSRARAYGRFGFGLEVKGKGSQTLVSPSIHPTGVRYQCLGHWGEPVPLTEQEYSGLLGFLGVTPSATYQFEPRARIGGKRALSEKEVLEIVSAVRPAYMPGHRNDLDLALAGWLLKAGVEFEWAKEVFKALTSDEDEDAKKKTMQRLEYTYQKAPGEVVGMRGKNAPGVEDILRELLGEEQAAIAVKKIQDVLGWASPWDDAVFEALDPGRNLYAVAWPHRKEMVRGQWVRKEGEPDRFVVREIVATVYPKRVVVFPNTMSSSTLYEVEFEGVLGAFKVGPASPSEIAERLKRNGWVKFSRLIDDVLSAILNGYVKKGKAEVVWEPERPGFYPDISGDGIVPVKIDCEPPPIDALRDGLAALDALIELSTHFREKAVEIVKRVLVAPFGYVYKTKGRFIPAMWLYGFTGAGKTTFTHSAFWIWGEPQQKQADAAVPRVTGGSSANTEPRLGEWLSRSGTPILINEAHKILENPRLMEMIKDAVESTVCRGKFVDYTVWTDVPSLAVPFFTANGAPPLDPAILRKLTVIQFTRTESAVSLSPKQRERFERWYREEAPLLPAVGKMTGFLVTVGRVRLTYDYRQDGENLLRALFAEIGVEPPEWVSLGYEPEEDTPDTRVQDLREHVRETIAGRLLSEYFRVFGRDQDSSNTLEDFRRRVTAVIHSRVVQWLIPIGCEGEPDAGGEECTVVVTSGLLRALGDGGSFDQTVTQDIATLKNLADILGDGWTYKLFRSKLPDGGYQVVRGVGTTLKNFIRFLSAVDDQAEGAGGGMGATPQAKP